MVLVSQSDSYTTLTKDMALQAMASAAITSTYNPSFSSSHIPSTTSPFIEEIPNDIINAQSTQSSITAVFPSSSSTPFVLGNGASDTESDPSLVSPIFVPH